MSKVCCYKAPSAVVTLRKEVLHVSTNWLWFLTLLRLGRPPKIRVQLKSWWCRWFLSRFVIRFCHRHLLTSRNTLNQHSTLRCVSKNWTATINKTEVHHFTMFTNYFGRDRSYSILDWLHARPWQVVTLTAGSERRSLLMAGDDDKMFVIRSWITCSSRLR